VARLEKPIYGGETIVDFPAPFEDFLIFERQIFGDQLPIPAYDPYLIRYGEYRFPLEILTFEPGETILDLGCESNIFILYLAYLGLKTIGVDINRRVWRELKRKKSRVERLTKRKLDITFKVEDATQLGLAPESMDKVIAISAIEHMFSPRGHGDQMAVNCIAQVLKPGGMTVITVPMSNGEPFHEAPQGDAQFNGPYRLYTPEALEERFLSNPNMETVKVSYLAQTTPDPYYEHLYFFKFWSQTLTAAERQKWAWANPILASIFNPIILKEEGDDRPETVNTALICLRKKG
jgi:SAM-dependent methyltransferase